MNDRMLLPPTDMETTDIPHGQLCLTTPSGYLGLPPVSTIPSQNINYNQTEVWPDQTLYQTTTPSSTHRIQNYTMNNVSVTSECIKPSTIGWWNPITVDSSIRSQVNDCSPTWQQFQKHNWGSYQQ